MQDIFVNWGIPIAQWLVIGGMGLALLFALLQLVQGLINDTANTVKTLAGMLVFFLFVFIVYTMADGSVSETFEKQQYAHVTPGLMKGVWAGILTSLLLVLGAFAIAVVMEIINMVK